MALAASIAAAFNPARVLNLVTPLGGITREIDIAYGTGDRQRLDLYLPKNAKNAPIVVFMYGGSWQRGDKGTYLFAAAALARRGMVVVVPDYTLYPEAGFPRFLEDAAAATAWTAGWARRSASSLGSSGGRLVLMGHSAGAHIAAMLAYDERWLAPHGSIRAVILQASLGLPGPTTSCRSRTRSSRRSSTIRG